MAQRQLTPAERNMLFARATRQNIQTLPSITVTPGQSVTFEVPKTRYLSKIGILVKGTINAKHATATDFNLAPFAPFNLIRQARIEANNGFAPFRVSGKMLYVYNRLGRNPESLDVVSNADARGRVLCEKVASSGGTDNDLRFYLEMPVMLNKRDPIGMINTQNTQTVVTVTLDFNELGVILASTTGYTLTGSLQVIPTIESFTVPIIPEARPDMSVLKLVQEYTQAIPGAGDVTFKFPVGTTYRRFAMLFEKADGSGFSESELTDIQLILNQADIPYKVNPYVLQAINQEQYGVTFEKGLFVMEFADQGIVGLGGSRDYIDSENLTEFWVKTNASVGGTLTVLTETLAELQG